ncbi:MULTISPECIES: ribosomal protection-like ABC-F family protein [Paenibacillus]|uniref:ABC transporter ATP-binding protein n=1 Tax=Paenibacillus campinasensis TaxID=66347 RepID=A0A268EP73_9BACL|nr:MULTISPECIES: ABC-F type ribosomal protection protein [Paenibacillus]PAD74901.1 ABC transporter ATP-binding protein [Paenibacillus campinasensis]PAK50078.1 ABC transporter ATP-binding protein [Paenibacillus sp. 7541]
MTIILKATDLRVELVGKMIFEHVNLEIAEGERLALFGRNGCGKSTLLSLLTGEREAAGGRIDIRLPRSAWGWMEQEPSWGDASVLEAVRRKSNEALSRLKMELEETERKMQTDESSVDAEGTDILERYGLLMENYESLGGFQWETDVERFLSLMGIGSQLWDAPFHSLSGGQKTRAMLASLLIQEPRFLLLDEPTNHLDQESLLWLEQWLQEYKGTVLYVSHDREFIDRTATAVCELTSAGLKRYKGGYTAYRREKERELREQEALHRKQEQERKALEESIRRYREWFHKAHNAAGDQEVKITASFYKAKANKNISRYHAKEKALERLESEAVRKPKEVRKLNMKLTAEELGAKTLVRVEDMSFSYGDRRLFDRLSFQVNRGDRIAVRGANGSGKTTLLKLLLGQLDPQEGKVVLHPALNIGYFSQELDNLDQEATLLDSLLVLPEMTQSQARTLLGSFLFSRDDVYKKIGDLSMGEKCRAAFLKLYFSGAHLLVLDEPTNYLDVDTREVIENVLTSFPGAMVLVSHDRYLIRQVANRLLTLQDDGQPAWFEGTVMEEEEQAARTTVIHGDTGKDNRRMELEYRIQELLQAEPAEAEVEQQRIREIRALREELGAMQANKSKR